MKNDRNYYRMLSDTDLIEKGKGALVDTVMVEGDFAELALVLAERLSVKKARERYDD